MFNVRNVLTNGTLVVPIFRVTTNLFTTVHVGGGIRTPADGIVTQKHNRWDRSTPVAVVGLQLTYVFRLSTPRDGDIYSGSGRQARRRLFLSHDLPIGYYRGRGPTRGFVISQLF